MAPRRADSLDRVPANSVAIDDYLKTIYHHTEWQSVAITPSQLAAELALAPSTVTEMVQKLAALGLVSHRPYGPVSLTDAGRARAAAIIRRHRLIETWLVREFDYAWDEVHDEAEVLEHHISEELEALIAARLGHPTHDPHGHPIPTADLVIDEGETVALDAMAVGQRGRFVRISDADPEMLRYLSDQGIALGDELRVTDRQPFGGPLVAEFGTTTLALGGGLARAMRVEVLA